MKNCYNCEAQLAEKDHYCPSCGQKHSTGKVALLPFLSEFFSNYFNLDSTIFRTLGALFIPGRLTQHFFAGKHKSFLHPLRIFLVAAAFFLGIAGYQINKKLTSEAIQLGTAIQEYSSRELALKKIDSLYQDFAFANQDSFPLSMTDTLLQTFKTIQIDSLESLFSFITVDGEKTDLQLIELLTEDQETIFEKHEVTDFWQKIIIGQTMRFTKAPEAYIRAALGNLIWMVILLMPAIALFLKLLYWRQNKYYVEHLVFSLHFNAFAFIITGLTLLIFPYSLTAISFSSLMATLFLFIAIYSYYSQSFPKSLLKWILLLYGYFVAISIFLSMSLGISFLLFE